MIQPDVTPHNVDAAAKACAIVGGCIIRIMEIGKASKSPDEKIFENIQHQCKVLMKGYEDVVAEFLNKVPPKFR